jgi:hypothetical protein
MDDALSVREGVIGVLANMRWLVTAIHIERRTPDE